MIIVMIVDVLVVIMGRCLLMGFVDFVIFICI